MDWNGKNKTQKCTNESYHILAFAQRYHMHAYHVWVDDEYFSEDLVVLGELPLSLAPVLLWGAPVPGIECQSQVYTYRLGTSANLALAITVTYVFSILCVFWLLCRGGFEAVAAHRPEEAKRGKPSVEHIMLFSNDVNEWCATRIP